MKRFGITNVPTNKRVEKQEESWRTPNIRHIKKTLTENES